jgi:CBS domain-containing protein
MAKVRDILTRKGSAVQMVAADTTVLDATQRMNDERLGSLVVTDGDRIVGMFTERDVLRRVVAEQRSPAETLVSEVMTRDVLCCTPGMAIEDASRIMKDHRVRHLPVCTDDGALLGMISIGDLNAYHASDSEATISFLNDYLYSGV